MRFILALQWENSKGIEIKQWTSHLLQFSEFLFCRIAWISELEDDFSEAKPINQW